MDAKLIQKIGFANSTFTPGTPIHRDSLFARRNAQVMSVVEAITRPGQHAIMFGERGVGKTSLANVIHSYLPSGKDFCVAKINASEEDSFTDLWQGILRELQMGAVKDGIVLEKDEANGIITQMIDQDPPTRITPNTVRFALSNLPRRNTLIIIDEFDRITDQSAISGIVDTIKTLSDYGLAVTILLVGVADSVDEIIKNHASLARALVQIPIPRMPVSELVEILDNGFKRLEMTIESDVKKQIVELSQGLPHYTHLLALESVLHALKNGRDHIEIEDLDVAIKAAITKTEESTRQAYYKAVTAPRGVLYPLVLRGCALAKTDARGFFSPADVGRALTSLTGEEFKVARFTKHLREFATPEKACVLLETGTDRKYRYRFRDPMMQPFIVLNGLAEGTIKADSLDSQSEDT